jgi:hypothetical protein
LAPKTTSHPEPPSESPPDAPPSSSSPDAHAAAPSASTANTATDLIIRFCIT